MIRSTMLLVGIAAALFVTLPASAQCSNASYSTRLWAANYMGFCNVSAYGGADCTEPGGGTSNAVFELYLRITNGWSGEVATNSNICSGNTCLVDTDYPSPPRHCYSSHMWVNIIDADTSETLIDEDTSSGTECCDGSLGT